jgi:hypothetical protein
MGLPVKFLARMTLAKLTEASFMSTSRWADDIHQQSHGDDATRQRPDMLVLQRCPTDGSFWPWQNTTAGSLAARAVYKAGWVRYPTFIIRLSIGDIEHDEELLRARSVIRQLQDAPNSLPTSCTSCRPAPEYPRSQHSPTMATSQGPFPP